MHPQLKMRLVSVCIASVLLPLSAHCATQSQTPEPVQSVWNPVEIRFSYVGFTTAYNCDAAESKLKRMLVRLGAPPQTRVHATGCIPINRPARNFFVEITTATPVAETDPAAAASKTKRELIERLGGTRALPTDSFPAVWKTVELSRDRRLNLRPGDCELMRALRDKVLPKLSIKVVSENVSCTPGQLSINTPELTVSALVPAPSPDTAGANEKPVTERP